MARSKPMLRLVSILLAACLVLPAATTTVQGTIINPDGTSFNGFVYIEISHQCSPSGGGRLGPTQVLREIVSGSMSIPVQPNDACTPSGTYYQVSYTSSGGSWRENWIVPTSGTPVDVSSVVVDPSSLPALGSSVPLSLLTGGSNPGDLIAYNGANFVHLPGGASGALLFMDSAESLGLEWETVIFWNDTGNKLTVGYTGAPVGVGYNNIAPTGTLDVLDRTPTTGNTALNIGWDGTNTSAGWTQVRVIAGAGQGTDELQKWFNNAATRLSSVAVDGGYAVWSSGTVRKMTYGNGDNLASDIPILWYNNADIALGTADLGLARTSAGNLAVTNGAGGSPYFIFDGPSLMMKFGGTTSAFPAWKRNGVGLEARLADNSASTDVLASFFNANTSGVGYFFGGGTSSYPGLKRNGTGIDVKLADDSAFTGVRALSFAVNTNGTIQYYGGPSEVNFGNASAEDIALETVANAAPGDIIFRTNAVERLKILGAGGLEINSTPGVDANCTSGVNAITVVDGIVTAITCTP